MIEKEFLGELKKVGSGLKAGKTTLSELRVFERQLDLIEIYREWNSCEAKFLAYSIKQIIGIIWRNFAVDTPIELSETRLEELSKTVGLFLTEAVDLLEMDETERTYKVFSSVINDLFSYIIEENKFLYDQTNRGEKDGRRAGKSGCGDGKKG